MRCELPRKVEHTTTGILMSYKIEVKIYELSVL